MPTILDTGATWQRTGFGSQGFSVRIRGVQLGGSFTRGKRTSRQTPKVGGSRLAGGCGACIHNLRGAERTRSTKRRIRVRFSERRFI